MRRLIVGFGVLLIAGLGAPAVRAACGGSVPVYHFLDSYFACADSTPVSAFMYEIEDPLVTSSGFVDVLLCESSSPTQTCFGVVGDGKVQVATDWGNPGMLGCPTFPNSPHRIAIVAQGADGKGLVASVSGASTVGYMVESAHPLNATADGALPLPCTDQAGAPRILAQSVNPGGQVTLVLHFAPPLVSTDCDPGSVGLFLGACVDNFQPNSQLGGIFTSVQPCNKAASLVRSAWTDTGIKPDSSGNATLMVTPPAGLCSLIGYTAFIGGFESGGIIGFVKLPGPACSDVDRDGDGFTGCGGDCDDLNPAVHPGATEICNGIDDNCNGLVDEGPTGVVDTDGDGVHDACDNCPTIPNPTQDPLACEQRVVNIGIAYANVAGKGTATLSWETTHELDIEGFDVLDIDQKGNAIRLNRTEIACTACVTALGERYSFIVPKHKSGHGLFIQLLRRNHVIEVYGPAIRVR